MTKPCIFIGTPLKDKTVCGGYSIALLGTYRHLAERGIGLHVHQDDGGGVVLSRNRILAEFMRDEEATHLLFIDSDHTWLPESVTHLLDANVPCVGAAYPARTIDWNRFIAFWSTGKVTEEEASLYASPLIFKLLPDWPPKQDGRRVEVLGVGTGFVLLTRALVTELWNASRDFAHQAPNGETVEHRLVFENGWTPAGAGALWGSWWGEDFMLCKRVRELGHSVWLDMFIRLEHTGPMSFVSKSPGELWMQKGEAK